MITSPPLRILKKDVTMGCSFPSASLCTALISKGFLAPCPFNISSCRQISKNLFKCGYVIVFYICSTLVTNHFNDKAVCN